MSIIDIVKDQKESAAKKARAARQLAEQNLLDFICKLCGGHTPCTD